MTTTLSQSLALYTFDQMRSSQFSQVDLKPGSTALSPNAEACNLYSTKPLLTVSLKDLNFNNSEKQALVDTVVSMHNGLNDPDILSMKKFNDFQLEVYPDGAIYLFNTKTNFSPATRSIPNSAHIGTMGKLQETIIISKLAPGATSQFKFIGSKNGDFQSVANKLAAAIKAQFQQSDLSGPAVRTSAMSLDQSILSSRDVMSSLAMAG